MELAVSKWGSAHWNLSIKHSNPPSAIHLPPELHPISSKSILATPSLKQSQKLAWATPCGKSTLSSQRWCNIWCNISGQTRPSLNLTLLEVHVRRVWDPEWDETDRDWDWDRERLRGRLRSLAEASDEAYEKPLGKRRRSWKACDAGNHTETQNHRDMRSHQDLKIYLRKWD